MNVVRHTIYLKHLVLVLLKNACNVFMQRFFPGSLNGGSPEFHGKNELNVQLRKGVCHGLIYLRTVPDGTISLKHTPATNKMFRWNIFSGKLYF